MEVAQVTDTEDDIREFARITPVDAAPEMAPSWRRCGDCRTSPCPRTLTTHYGTTRPSSSKTSARVWRSTRRPRVWLRPDAPGTFPEMATPCCRRGRSRSLGPTRSRCRGTSRASTSAATAQSTAGCYRCSTTGGSAWSSPAAGRPDSRTAYLHVDYRKITPTDEPLVSRAWIDSVDGRKMVVRATMTDSDGNVLSEANGLMIKLLPHQR